MSDLNNNYYNRYTEIIETNGCKLTIITTIRGTMKTIEKTVTFFDRNRRITEERVFTTTESTTTENNSEVDR